MNHSNPATSAQAVPTLEGATGAIRPLSLWLRRTLGAVVALVLFAIMGITFCDVFMRYWFSAPIRGASEFVRFGMAIVIFSAFPLVTLNQQHITVNLLQGRFGPLGSWLQHLFVLLVSGIVIGIMTWQLASDGTDLAHNRITTTVLEWPLAPLSYFMSALSGVTLLVLIVLTLVHLTAPSRKEVV
ncbi:TRAP transporter small permease [Burkholderia multivorans]|uniref:TRAP transporter small permease n=1 Tax=Burkholderia multivorans TaxID=87883 RepID=UPI0019D291B5|nr:TRAP transporter small permease [Burkholderia multivorans]MBN6731240.1 TRAP transporter small permease [Burkholderia multivorans]MBN6733490.1 TRAP transporter small permease [Burkholderia multivorans]MBN7130586.1 TRAP transporter small permease [Burkholderia multivorans]MBN8165054.1 TRAP transporter small permease [Burkholderia multivorans]MBN8170843.1 TRAP transporter small permease [Burkholderia multivorans]